MSATSQLRRQQPGAPGSGEFLARQRQRRTPPRRRLAQNFPLRLSGNHSTRQHGLLHRTRRDGRHRGPSGAGKSTFLHSLAALDTPTSGTIYFERNSLEALAEHELAEYRNHSVGFVWQRHHLLPDFTSAENVAMPLLISGVARESALRSAGEWLGEVGLGGRDNQRAGELSGGEQQRVAIARALVNRPKLLLADEPTGDLDERNAELIFDLMRRLHLAHRLTSILATHNLSLAQRANRVLHLEHGRLTQVEEAAARARNLARRRPRLGLTPRESVGDSCLNATQKRHVE